jgi:hypothetical protein
MADENEHGLGFPKDHKVPKGDVEVEVTGVDKDVAQVLQELYGN